MGRRGPGSERQRSGSSHGRLGPDIRSLGQLMALLLVACSASSGPPSGPTALPSATSAPARPGSHVFVVVMENRDYATALAQPYTTQLAHRYAVATNYHAIAHPSLPNYLALTSGATFGISDDDFHRLPAVG